MSTERPADDDMRRTSEDTPDADKRLTDAERAALLREQIKRLRVADVAGDVMISLVTLGYQKLGLTSETLEMRDLADARLAIELLHAMLDVMARERATTDLRDFRSTVAQMQLNYARAASEEVAASKVPAADEAPPTREAAKAEGEAPPRGKAPAGGKGPKVGKAPPRRKAPAAGAGRPKDEAAKAGDKVPAADEAAPDGEAPAGT